MIWGSLGWFQVSTFFQLHKFQNPRLVIERCQEGLQLLTSSIWNWVIIMGLKLKNFKIEEYCSEQVMISSQWLCGMCYFRAFRLLQVAKTGQSNYGDGQGFCS